MKRIRAISFRTGIAIMVVIYIGLLKVYSQGVSAVWANEGGDKVTREELRVGQPNGRAVLNHIWNGSKISIRGAKNEVVNFNVIIEAASKQASDVSVSFNTLTGPGGVTIKSSPVSGDGIFNWIGRPVELFYVRYLQIKGLSQLGYENYYDERHVPERFRRKGYNMSTGSASGTWQDRPDHDKYYPDIAVPIELVPSFNITAGQNQSIWADIYIPDDAVPGIYSGIMTIRESSYSPISIPVELTVYNFSLPDMPTAKTMLVISGENINDRFFGKTWIDGADKSRAKLIQDRYFYIAHRHKISLINNASSINSDNTTADHPAGHFAERLKGNFFSTAKGYDGPGVNTGNNVYSLYTYGGWA